MNYRRNELKLLRKGGVWAQLNPAEVYGKSLVSCNWVSWTGVWVRVLGITWCFYGVAFSYLHRSLFQLQQSSCWTSVGLEDFVKMTVQWVTVERAGYLSWQQHCALVVDVNVSKANLISVCHKGTSRKAGKVLCQYLRCSFSWKTRYSSGCTCSWDLKDKNKRRTAGGEWTKWVEWRCRE